MTAASTRKAELPQKTVQKLIQQSYENGARCAIIYLTENTVEYSDTAGYRQIIEYSHMDPDDTYSVHWDLMDHYVPDDMEVSLISNTMPHPTEGNPVQTTLRTFSQEDVALPENTPSGRFTVHLKSPERQGFERTTIIDSDGAAVNAGYNPVMYKRTQGNQPGDAVTEYRLNVLAHPSNRQEPARQEPANYDPQSDKQEIRQTVLQLTATYLNRMMNEDAQVLAWPGEETKQAMLEADIPGIPGTPLTSRKCLAFSQHSPEILQPDNAVISKLPYTSGPALDRALSKHPDTARRYTLIEDEGGSRNHLPSITLVSATAELQDGTTMQIPVPEPHPDHGHPVVSDKRFEQNLFTQVKSITAVLEYSAPEGAPERFELETDLYADSDQRNHIILTTPKLEIDEEEFQTLTGIRFFNLVPWDAPAKWAAAYHTRRLTGKSLTRLNMDTLKQIAEAIGHLGIEQTKGEFHATSEDGTITVILHRKQSPAE